MRKVLATIALVELVLLLGALGLLGSILAAEPAPPPKGAPPAPPAVARQGDSELAYLLVKLELQTRSVIAGHFTRPQSGTPGVDQIYQRWLTRNLVLPAAVAGGIFAETVPAATGGRAWVRMVVREPRNPDNTGDATALEMLDELEKGAGRAERSGPGATYYGEPIITKDWCLRCHGEPKGEPDPSFPQYPKDGWRAGQVIGGVIARVAPAR